MNFGLWMITKVEGDDWIVMKSKDSAYGVQDGDVFVWMESFCSRMVKGSGPTFAPESDRVMAYKEAEIGRKIPIQAYMGFPIFRDNGELLGTVCAIDKSPVPPQWAEYQDFVASKAAELSNAYSCEYKAQLTASKQRYRLSDTQDLIQVLLSHDWNSLMQTHEERARISNLPYSVSVVKADLKLKVDSELTTLVHKVIGRENFLVYHGKGLFSMLLLDCSAPKLDAYLNLLRATFENFGADFHIAGATRSEARGLNFAYDQALGKVISLGYRKQIA